MNSSQSSEMSSFELGSDLIISKADLKKLTAEERHDYELSEPIFLTNAMVNCPVILIVIAFGFMLLISVVVISFDWLMPQSPSNRDFLVWGDPVVNEYDMGVLIKSYLKSQTAIDMEIVPT